MLDDKPSKDFFNSILKTLSGQVLHRYTPVKRVCLETKFWTRDLFSTVRFFYATNPKLAYVNEIISDTDCERKRLEHKL